MAWVKAEKVVQTTIGLLEREIVLPGLVFRDAAINFDGAKNDTVTIKVPAYAVSRERELRSETGYTVDSLADTGVNIQLDADVYKAVGITDEEMTLDITNFEAQVMNPVVRSVAVGVEDKVAATMTGASHDLEVEIDTADPYLSLIDARKKLNDAKVPFAGRVLAVGSTLEADILKSDHLSEVQLSGSDSAFREAVIGRIAGFTAVSCQGIGVEEGFAFHATAFPLATRAPVVPDGVGWGASASFAGLAMRTIKDYDFDNVRDRLLANVYVGVGVTTDKGTLDEDGVFTPAEDPEDSDADDLLVRSVKLTYASS